MHIDVDVTLIAHDGSPSHGTKKHMLHLGHCQTSSCLMHSLSVQFHYLQSDQIKADTLHM